MGLRDGGIFGLLDLIEERRGALEYDFRTRFHIDLSTLPDPMGWDEAARLVTILRADPSSMLAAAVEGWDHPVSREVAVLMDLWDLEAAKTGAKRPPTYPRVWKAAREVAQSGDAAGRTPEEVKALLREKFGQPEAPV